MQQDMSHNPAKAESWDAIKNNQCKVQKNWYMHIRNISCVPFDIVESMADGKVKSKVQPKADVTVRTIIAGPLHPASIITNFASPF